MGCKEFSQGSMVIGWEWGATLLPLTNIASRREGTGCDSAPEECGDRLCRDGLVGVVENNGAGPPRGFWNG